MKDNGAHSFTEGMDEKYFKPDFEIKPLDQYPKEELEGLLTILIYCSVTEDHPSIKLLLDLSETMGYVRPSQEALENMNRFAYSSLKERYDTWLYRIQEALKLKRKNETTKI